MMFIYLVLKMDLVEIVLMTAHNLMTQTWTFEDTTAETTPED